MSLRLFCFPYAGSGTSIYRDWQKQIGDGAIVCPVRLPGREMRLREPPVGDLRELVCQLADALEPALSTPYAFFGHSMGALLSYEIAALLRERGRPLPQHLFVSARPAPRIERQMIPVPVRTLTDDQLVAYLRSIQSPFTMMDEPELLRVLLPVLRADFKLCQAYYNRRHAPFTFPITAFGGTHDSTVAQDEIALWREATSGPFRARLIEGDHFFIHGSTQLVADINDDLRRLLTGQRGGTA